MRYILSLPLACSLLVAGVARADDADARKIVDKALKATGAAGAAKTPAVTWKGKGIFYGGGNEFPYTGTWSQHLPDKFRLEIEGVFLMVVNGDKGWRNDAEMTAEQLTEQREANHAAWAFQLHPLTGKAFTLKLVGESKVEDKPAIGVKISHKDRRDVTLFFDKESGLPVKYEQTVKDEMSGKEMTQESFIKAWLTSGDVKVPSKMIIKREGKVYIDGEVTDYKLLEKLPDETFAKP